MVKKSFILVGKFSKFIVKSSLNDLIISFLRNICFPTEFLFSYKQKLNAGSAPEQRRQLPLRVVFINIALTTRGVRNKEVESQHVSSLKKAVFAAPPLKTLY